MSQRIRQTPQMREQSILLSALVTSLADNLGAAAPSQSDLLDALADAGLALKTDSGDLMWRCYLHHIQQQVSPVQLVTT